MLLFAKITFIHMLYSACYQNVLITFLRIISIISKHDTN